MSSVWVPSAREPTSRLVVLAAGELRPRAAAHLARVAVRATPVRVTAVCTRAAMMAAVRAAVREPARLREAARIARLDHRDVVRQM